MSTGTLVRVALLLVHFASGGPTVAELLRRGSLAPESLPPLARSVPINDDRGVHLGTVELRAGDEPADAAYAFCVERGLGPDFRARLVDALCASGACARRRARLLASAVQAPAGLGAGALPGGELELWEGEEPVDTVHALSLIHISEPTRPY